MANTYSSGTVAVVAGSKNVTISGGLSISLYMRPGDFIAIEGGLPNAVASLTDATHFVLAREFDGATDAAASFIVIHMPTAWGDRIELNEQTAEIIRLLGQDIPFTAEQLAAANAAAATAVSKAAEAVAAASTATSQTAIAVAKAAEATASAASLAEVDSAAFNNRKLYLTWAALVAVAGTAGAAAEVQPSDTDTHTGYKYGDDVSTAGLANAGVYLWSTSLAAWRRVFSSTIVTASPDYGVFISKTDGSDIPLGGFIATISAPATGAAGRFIGRMLQGAGYAEVVIVVDGFEVYGPVTILPGAPFVDATLNIPINQGKEVAFYILDIEGCSSLWLQIDGGF